MLRNTLTLASLFTVFVACSSGSGGGDEAPPTLQAGADLSGTWEITSVVQRNDGDLSFCTPDPVGTSETETVQFAFTASSGLLVFDEGTSDELRSTLEGLSSVVIDTIALGPLSGSSRAELVFAPDGSRFTGTLVETITDGSATCSSTSGLTGVKVTTPQPPQPPQPPQVPTEVGNADIDGQGPVATVLRDVPFMVEADISIANPENCPSCIQQLVLGFNDIGAACIYDGVPGILGVQERASVMLTGSTIGTFDLRWQNSFEFTCAAALGLFRDDQSESLGSFTVVDEAAFSIIPQVVNIAGQGASAVVSAGSQVALDFDFRAWGLASCPGCICQVTIGLDDDPVGCAYNGGLPSFPGQDEVAQVQFQAPSAPGIYTVRYRLSLEFNCSDAQNKYALTPPSANAIGTIVVQ